MPAPAVLQSARIPFLVLSPACVFLGVCLAWNQNTPISIFHLILTILGATLAHISVNTLNEYQDFKSGLDLATERTPFSGGSGGLPAKPENAGKVFTLGWLSLLATVLIGLYLCIQVSWALLPIGLVGCAIIAGYTPWINRSPLLCLFAPGFGFGLLMVCGTVIALGGQLDLFTVLCATVALLLVNNLLLLNQYPDREADQQHGRRHLTISHGIAAGNAAYALSALAAMGIILWLLLTGELPIFGWLLLGLVIPIGFALKGALQYGDQLGAHPQHLAANVAVAVFTPVLLGAAILMR